MCPELYAFPNYALGVSRWVFSNSLKSHPEIHDEISQTQCRPGAPALEDGLWGFAAGARVKMEADWNRKATLKRDVANYGED